MILIKNAKVVNEGTISENDVLIKNGRIEKIAKDIAVEGDVHLIDAAGKHLLPGMIDDQVHFRDPGLNHKATIATESAAAVAGGVTSFMDMPNTIPNVLTQELLEEKYTIAANTSLANYSFYMGVNKTNIDEALKTNNETVCGITDDGLYLDNPDDILVNYPEYVDQLFSRAETIVSLHCEDTSIIKENLERVKQEIGEDIPPHYHPIIRNDKGCYSASSTAIEIAKKHNTRFHIFHMTSGMEVSLLENKTALRDKRITAEACVHHLWFTDADYEKWGSLIKWNPAIKTANDRETLMKGLNDDFIDIIATDHAPHTYEEKQGSYFTAKPGGPLIQHAMPAMLDLYHRGEIELTKIVEKTSHNVAEIYRMVDRGYIREGYFADVVLVDLNESWTVSKENILYKCGWSPFEGHNFQSKITHTIVSGELVYENGKFVKERAGERLLFEKVR